MTSDGRLARKSPAAVTPKPKTPHRARLVQTAADKLRDLILEQESGTQIGSLGDVARQLRVGIATVQQAARILEHEGLLQVRRGPGGGYYGMRPDDAALERSVASYIRVHPSAFGEVIDITGLLETELFPAAAKCSDEGHRAALRSVLARIPMTANSTERIAIEEEFRQIVFAMVQRPLLALIFNVTIQIAKTHSFPPFFPSADSVAVWKAGRERTIRAILEGDPELALFEATRFRDQMLKRSRQAYGSGTEAAAAS